MDAASGAEPHARGPHVHRDSSGCPGHVALDADQTSGRTRTRRRDAFTAQGTGTWIDLLAHRGCQDLAAVIEALGEWGERWVEVTTVHADPGFALWAWCQAQLDRSKLPPDRVVVAFTFPDESPGNRYYWLLVEHGDAEVCYADPGDDADLHVIAESQAFVDWHQGAISWSAAQRDGRITVNGPQQLVRALGTWNLHAPIAPRI